MDLQHVRRAGQGELLDPNPKWDHLSSGSALNVSAQVPMPESLLIEPTTTNAAERIQIFRIRDKKGHSPLVYAAAAEMCTAGQRKFKVRLRSTCPNVYVLQLNISAIHDCASMDAANPCHNDPDRDIFAPKEAILEGYAVEETLEHDNRQD